MRWLLPLLALLPALALAEGPRVTLSTTQGDIVIELNQEQAPATAANFPGATGPGEKRDARPDSQRSG